MAAGARKARRVEPEVPFDSAALHHPVIPSPEPPRGLGMPFRLSKRSLDKLAGVKPEMASVVKRAIELTEVDFVVVQGNRTLDEQKRLYGQGRNAAQCAAAGVPKNYAQPSAPKVTWTLNSNHIGGRAVDLAPYVNGAIEWDNSGKLGLYPKINDAMKRAAAELGVKIGWGGDWQKTPDRPHFELQS